MKKSYLFTLALLASNVAFAEKEEHREHGAHQHGHAQLSVILEKNELLVMLETPAMNVFGFEHKPENDEQHKVVDSAVKDLENFGALLSVDADAKCRLVKADVQQPFVDDDHKDGHDDHKDEHNHDDHKDKHDDHKDEHNHDDHKDEHDDHKDEHKHDDHKHDEDHKESTHSDVDVEISYSCDNPSKLTKMDLTSFFKRFPLFEEIDAQGIINGQQSAKELSKDEPVLSLKK